MEGEKINSRNFYWLIRGGFGLIRSEGGEKESKKMGVCVFQGKCREVEGKQEHAIFDMIWEKYV